MPEPPRQHQRCPGRFPVDLRLGSWGEFLRLYTRDLSCGGLFVETDDPPDVFSSVEVTLHLPDGAGSITLVAQVVRSVPADCKPQDATAGMGLRITHIDDAHQRQLAAWFEQARGGSAAPAPPPTDEALGGGSVPSITEAELPAVPPAPVHAALQRKLAALVGDPFDVLGVPRTIDAKDLRGHYLALAKKYHPERWAHYEDAEITELTRRLADILGRAYDKAKAALEGQASAASEALPRPPADSSYRYTHAELADFAVQVHEVRPSPPGARVDLKISQALKHLALKHYDVARAELKRVLQQAPDSKAAQIWVRVAEARQRKQQGDEAGAVAIYREILSELDPTHGEALKEVRASGGRLSSLFKKITGR